MTRNDSRPQRHHAPWLLAAVLAASAALWPAFAGANQDLGLTLRIDPNFSRARLTPTEQLWYDRVWTLANASAATVDTRAGYDDTYTYGRSVGDFNAYLLMGLRATGDRAFLDRVVHVTDIMRSKLKDAWDDGTTDGFVNWRWRAIGIADPSDPYYGKDTHQMDEAMTHGNIGLIAYAFYVNRDIDTTYANRAAFWRDYLENQFLRKWTQRAGGDPVAAWENEATGFYKRLTHPRANQLRLAYYLWKITNNNFYLQRAQYIGAELLAHPEPNPEVPSAYRWKHQVAGSDQGWQLINYAQYYMTVVCEMHIEQFLGFETDAEIARYTSTFRDVVFGPYGPNYSTMLDPVYGTTTSSSFLYGLSSFARWDPSGTMLAVANRLYNVGLYGVQSAGGALMAVSTRTASGGSDTTPPARITNLATTLVSDVGLTLTWTAPSDNGPSGRAASYQLRRSGQPITDANFASATTIPISQTPQAAGTAEQFAVGGLTPGTLYYFAIRSVDQASNTSLASNSPTATTLVTDTIPPAQIQDLIAQ